MIYKEKNVSIVDIETTDTKPNIGEIVELGLCSLDLETGKITPILDIIMKESDNFNKNAWIFKNTDLTIEKILKAKHLEYYRNTIQEILDLFPITAFNKAFDFKWLRSRGFKIKRELPCLMLSATQVLKLKNNYGYSSYKWANAMEAYHYFIKDSDYVESHRALDDSIHEAQILYQMYKRNEWKPELN